MKSCQQDSWNKEKEDHQPRRLKKTADINLDWSDQEDVEKEEEDQEQEPTNMGFVPRPEEKQKYRKIQDEIVGFVPRAEDTKRIQAEKTTPINDYLGQKVKATEASST